LINTKEILEPETTYHLYNRANGWERVFLSAENYRFFLQKYQQYITPIADTFCYCLMPNHFHFLIRIKSEKELELTFPKLAEKNTVTLEKSLSKQFSNLFSSYTQAFNKQNNRMGSLFMKNFKRIKVSDQIYFLKLVHYIHYNPVESNLCNRPEDWDHSSYNILRTDKPTFLKRDGTFPKFTEDTR
jgi:REP element-mobilizing transposase RayT